MIKEALMLLLHPKRFATKGMRKMLFAKSEQTICDAMWEIRGELFDIAGDVITKNLWEIIEPKYAGDVAFQVADSTFYITMNMADLCSAWCYVAVEHTPVAYVANGVLNGPKYDVEKLTAICNAALHNIEIDFRKEAVENKRIFTANRCSFRCIEVPGPGNPCVAIEIVDHETGSIRTQYEKFMKEFEEMNEKEE